MKAVNTIRIVGFVKADSIEKGKAYTAILARMKYVIITPDIVRGDVMWLVVRDVYMMRTTHIRTVKVVPMQEKQGFVMSVPLLVMDVGRDGIEKI